MYLVCLLENNDAGVPFLKHASTTTVFKNALTRSLNLVKKQQQHPFKDFTVRGETFRAREVVLNTLTSDHRWSQAKEAPWYRDYYEAPFTYSPDNDNYWSIFIKEIAE